MNTPIARAAARGFQTSARQNNAATLSASKPFEGIRTGVVGFLAGVTATSAASYTMFQREFKESNDKLLDDLYVRVAI